MEFVYGIITNFIQFVLGEKNAPVEGMTLLLGLGAAIFSFLYWYFRLGWISKLVANTILVLTILAIFLFLGWKFKSKYPSGGGGGTAHSYTIFPPTDRHRRREHRLLRRAKNGKRKAMYNLGLLYRWGEGSIPQDETASFNWYQKAVNAGHIRAMNKLAWFYNNGVFVPQDCDRAISLWHKAAEAGHALSANNLASRYLEGKCVGKDLRQALYWSKEALRLGHRKTISIRRRISKLEKEIDWLLPSREEETNLQSDAPETESTECSSGIILDNTCYHTNNEEDQSESELTNEPNFDTRLANEGHSGTVEEDSDYQVEESNDSDWIFVSEPKEDTKTLQECPQITERQDFSEANPRASVPQFEENSQEEGNDNQEE